MGSSAPVHNDIAIIGMACRLPGDATNTSKLWDLLIEGGSAWSTVPASKWNADAHYHPSQEHAGSTIVKGGHFLRDGDQNGKQFDAAFFNITRTEAETMDLQQRIVMENVYEAMESAGLRLEDMKGSNTSVFAGVFTDDTRMILNEEPELPLKYKPIGASAAILAARVSWFYDLRGSSFTLDTACSSSLVALHQGCQDLRAGLSEMSIITGVNIIESPEFMYRASGLGFVSPDGRCFSFDHRANGYGRGEGVGTLLLKPVAAAVRDGDVIRAVIRGSGVNSDGRGTGAITLPNKAAQERLMRDVYARNALDLDHTSYIEGHMTGTPAGDPIEASAIAATFQRGGPNAAAKPPLYVGAVKTNIGHLEAASGVAQVIKTVMVLEKGLIPPNVNFEKINPRIPIDRWGLKLPLKPTVFEEGPEGVRRASINSFGFGGTNAHLVLDDARSYLDSLGLDGLHATKSPHIAQKKEESQATGGHKIFLFSANDEDGISRVLASFAEHLQKLKDSEGSSRLDDAYLSNLAFTLSERRSRLAWRLAITADSITSLLTALTEPTTSAIRPGKVTSPAAAFIFTGQGAQWFAMGRELLSYDLFRARVAEADTYLESLGCGFSVLEELTQRNAETTKIDQPLYSQTLCTVLQVALVDLLASWNLLPKRVIGHSSGEIGAAYAAGALDRESAWKVAYYRGVVSAKPSTAGSGTRGAMMAVGCSAEEVAPLIAQVNEKLGDQGELVIACYNSPHSLTISGDEAKIDALGEVASVKKLFARKLRVAKAYHSSHMVPVCDEYRSLMGDLTQNPDSSAAAVDGSNAVQVFSSVTGGLVDANEMGKAEYWCKNLVSPVQFSQALVALCTSNVAKKQLKVGGGAELPVTHLVEVGPHSALQAAARDAVLSDPNYKALKYVSVLSRGKHACATALSSVGALAMAGFPIHLPKVNSPGETTKSSQAQLLVDLPPYPFHHSKETELWVESRTSRAWRFRKHPRHDILGAAVRDWDPEAPRWRNHLRVSELPWLRDHKVTGSIVVAGVTYLAMAIEAIRQLSAVSNDKEGQQVPLLGFNLRDVSISRALQLSEDEATETMFSMKRLAESRQADSSIWWEWKVTSFNAHNETWMEHARGQIAAETEASPHIATGVIDGGKEAAARERQYSDLLASAVQTCTTQQTKDLSAKYSELERIGLEFGPLFRNITSVLSAATPSTSSENGKDKRGQSLTTVRVPDLAQAMPAHALTDSVIHAPAFDSILHTFIFALQASKSSSGGRLTEPMVPVAIRSVWVSADIEAQPNAELTVHAASGLVGHKRVEADITAWSSGSRTDDEAPNSFNDPVRLVIRGLEAVPLQESTAAGNAANETREICYSVEWKPDIDILEETGAVEACLRETLQPLELPGLRERDAKQLNDVQLACTLYIIDAVKELQQRPLADESALPEHLQKYLGWLRLIADDYTHNKVFSQNDSWKAIVEGEPAVRQRFLAEYEASGHPEALLVCRIGRDIAPILRGDVDALHLLFGMDDLLEKFYRVAIGTEKIHRLIGAYAGALSHKRGADLRVLEIGAGTGGTTTSVLEAICPTGTRINGASRLLKYTYTDISPSFFEQAATKFAKWKAGGLIEFRTLDIEKDIEEQGFDESSYDLIIAANCLHATTEITKTMTRVHSLLKPNGKLFLQETTELGCLESPIAFGMLSGWWAAKEDFRPWGPLLTNQGWQRVLRDVGFSETVLTLDDSLSAAQHVQSMIVATKPKNEAEEKANSGKLDEDDVLNRVFVIARSSEDLVLAEALASALAGQVTKDNQVSVVQFADLAQHTLKNTCCIVTLETSEPFLASSFTQTEFELLRQLVTTAGGLLWLTRDPYENPHMALMSGLLRTVRWERDLDGSDLVLLHLPASADTSAVIPHITNVYKHHFTIPDRSLSPDRHAEYLVEAGGFLQTARIVASPPINDFIAQRTTVLQPQLQAFGADPSRSLMLHTSAPGRLDKLHFIDWPGAQEAIKPGEVQIEVKAVGLNFRDIMVAMGEVVNNILGYEGAGVVTHVGSNVKDVQVGDRVLFVWSDNSNCLQTRTRISQDRLAKIPDSMSFEEAAGIPIIFVTAYFCLYEVARLKAGETILVHAAAGGTGQAVIQLAQHLGAEVYATVSSREKRKLLMDEYGIPDDHILSSRDLSFAAGIMRMTNGKGVDVIVNSLAGEALRASFNCIAMFGRFVEIGKRDIMANGKMDMLPFNRCATFTAVDLVKMADLAREKTHHMLKAVVELHANRTLHACKPLNLHTFGEIEDAFRILQQGKHMGKMILTASTEDIVKVVPKPPSPTRLRPDATYLLPGGAGGLGRSIAKWMAGPDQGAKNIVFLSRSGGETETTRELLTELAAMGVRAKAFKCNVAHEEQLVAALKEAQDEGFPRIAGVIQGAMQLRDSAFEFMAHEQWEDCLAPKVRGTWNLHKHLPSDMDFFVMLSSVAGLVGNRGQSNYAAGNTFQDALAVYRRSQGLAASCLDLCNIMSVGFVAENQETLNKNPLFFFSHDGIREDEFQSLIEFHLDAERAGHLSQPQVAVGLAPLSVFRQRGLPEPTFIKTPLFRTMRSESEGMAAGGAESGAAGEDGGVSVTNALKFAESLEVAAEVIRDALVKRLSRTMRIPVAEIDVGKPIHVYGVDSLVAMEVRNYLASECGSEISVLEIMGNKSMDLLSNDIAKGSKFVRLDKAA
ncbi:Type I Iterative PKS [Gnomoniopsis sp. IMI 355080]|nr:Type I Iterative PKS [Gnomoniopsis sp. IMI 355080]